jgi:hypothetical protein
MNNFELIDDYLANRLKGGEREAFESQLGNDPALKSELELQKQIVEGIKHARATELKAMLSRVPVGGAQIEFSVLRIAAGVVLAGVVSAATYYYFKSEESFPPIENAAADVAKKDSAKPEETKPEATTTPEENEGDKVVAPEKKEKASKENPSEEIKPAVKPSIELADPSAELSEESRPSVELPESGSKPEIAPSHVQVQMDSSNKKYDFHYQFAGNKLMLYGSFDRSLYEVLEINNGNHALFLFYKNNFYLLDESNKDITKLSAITDQALLKKLREYRSR